MAGKRVFRSTRKKKQEFMICAQRSSKRRSHSAFSSLGRARRNCPSFLCLCKAPSGLAEMHPSLSLPPPVPLSFPSVSVKQNSFLFKEFFIRLDLLGEKSRESFCNGTLSSHFRKKSVKILYAYKLGQIIIELHTIVKYSITIFWKS